MLLILYFCFCFFLILRAYLTVFRVYSQMVMGTRPPTCKACAQPFAENFQPLVSLILYYYISPNLCPYKLDEVFSLFFVFLTFILPKDQLDKMEDFEKNLSKSQEEDDRK